jgi:hypothetical protein
VFPPLVCCAASPLDAQACLSWLVVFPPVVCCAACLVLEEDSSFSRSNSKIRFKICLGFVIF